MPRPLTVQCRSLLSPPVCIRSQTLLSFTRPRCVRIRSLGASPATTCLAQRRSLHLYKTAKAKTALGMHKVLEFEQFEIEPPSASGHKVNLVKGAGSQDMIAKGLSLQELYDHHVSPGKLLYMADPIGRFIADHPEQLRAMVSPSQFSNYAIVDAHSTPVKITNPQREGKQLGSLKNVILLLSNPVSYTQLALDRAYQFIEAGCPVELRIRLPSKGGSSEGMIKWMHEHFPHFRYDFILKSMPQGTKFLIKPFTDGQIVQYVLALPTVEDPKLDLTTRLLRVREAVEGSLSNNTMAHNYLARKEKRARQKQGLPPVEGGKSREEKVAERGIKTSSGFKLVAGTGNLMKRSKKNKKRDAGEISESNDQPELARPFTLEESLDASRAAKARERDDKVHAGQCRDTSTEGVERNDSSRQALQNAKMQQ